MVNVVATWGYGAAAVAYLGFGLYLFMAWRGGLAGGALLATVLASAFWSSACALHAAQGTAWLGQMCVLLDVVRAAAWFGFLIVLLRPMLGVRTRWAQLGVAFVVVGQLLEGMGWLAFGQREGGMVFWLAAAVLGLVLVEQLYRGVPSASRWALKPLCLALGAGYVFELYLFADGFLFGRLDADVWSVRGLAHALLIPLIAVSGARNPAWTLRMSLSREVAFHSTALAATGLYLLVIAGAGYYVRYFGGDWGRALQATLLFAGLVLLGVVAFSGAQRARLRVLVNKHLFPYRYDYRTEWLRFTQALSSADGRLDLGQSVIKALSDLVESPGGGLWLRNAAGGYAMHSRLNHPEVAAIEGADSSLIRFLDERDWILNLEEFRGRPKSYEGLRLPEWLSSLREAWLVVPLKTGGSMIGFVILRTPRARFEIDWEVLDLLRTAQRQAASYLERMQATEALLEARKFESFNRMSAFVVHDLKNLVAQLSLMLKNAERHRHNPEFQADMLETVAHVEARMRGLMAQLQEKSSIDPPRAVELVALAERVRQAKRLQRPAVDVVAEVVEGAHVLAHPERLERVLGHIVQNALDATNDDGKVSVRIHEPRPGRLTVVVEDSGRGMSPEFLRERLSRPFQTTKASGMGLGVFEARQYLTELGGDIRYESAIGVGTTVTIELPAIRRGTALPEQGVTSEHG